MSHDYPRREEISNAVDRVLKAGRITLESSDILNLYFSLLQNSTYQAMLNSFLADKGILSRDELMRLDRKNSDYNEAVDKFLSTVAKNISSGGEAPENE